MPKALSANDRSGYGDSTLALLTFAVFRPQQSLPLPSNGGIRKTNEIILQDKNNRGDDSPETRSKSSAYRASVSLRQNNKCKLSK